MLNGLLLTSASIKAKVGASKTDVGDVQGADGGVHPELVLSRGALAARGQLGTS